MVCKNGLYHPQAPSADQYSAHKNHHTPPFAPHEPYPLHIPHTDHRCRYHCLHAQDPYSSAGVIFSKSTLFSSIKNKILSFRICVSSGLQNILLQCMINISVIISHKNKSHNQYLHHQYIWCRKASKWILLKR